ncbi:MAG TPA: TIGR00645 family protein [Opitutaceae bacterium]
MAQSSNHKPDSRMESLLERSIFASRWLQAPLYAGLIIAQSVYVYQFFIELWHLIHAAFTGTYPEKAAPDLPTFIMLSVLGLIDVVMIANLLIMVIIGGYETFVSRLHLDDHSDQPEWLNHVNAGVLKVKLATALISISSIHLLKTFITVNNSSGPVNNDGVMWQVIIHIVFVASAIALAWTDKLMMAGVKAQHDDDSPKH